VLLPLPDARRVRFVRVSGQEKKEEKKLLLRLGSLRKLVREMPYGPSEGTSPFAGPRRQSKPCEFSHSWFDPGNYGGSEGGKVPIGPLV